MISNLLGVSIQLNFSVLSMLFLASSIGLYLRFLLSYLVDQNELKSFKNFLVFLLLPAIGFLITSVISSNIALSLGMVGALSIVRFRTPVKNPLELINYFLLITIGIVLNANPNIALNFCLYIGIIFLLLKTFSKFNKNFLYKIFVDDTSSDGFYLRIQTSKEFNKLKSSEYLKHQSFNGNEYLYIFSSKQKQYLENILKEVDEDSLINYSFDF